jgi:hypothetical protein
VCFECFITLLRQVWVAKGGCAGGDTIDGDFGPSDVGSGLRNGGGGGGEVQRTHEDVADM